MLNWQNKFMGYIFADDNIRLTSSKFAWWALQDIMNVFERATAVQGHPRSLILIPFKRAYATSYQYKSVITLVLTCTVSDIRLLRLTILYCLVKTSAIKSQKANLKSQVFR